MSYLKVALVQTQQFWEDKSANLRHFDSLIEAQLSESIDVLIFPEMFHTGFSMHSTALAENTSDSIGLIWLKEKASSFNCLCVASLIIEDDGRYFNRMVAVYPEGAVEHYDKIHLFSLAKEDKHYTPGEKKTIVEFRGWKILLQVCYDLRFPENSRNSISDDEHFAYDAIVYVANWPEKRIAHWDILLPARAIENQCYVLAVNRVGSDNNNLNYNGSTQVIDAMGSYPIEPLKNTEKILTVQLSKELLLQTRKNLAFLKDRKVQKHI